VGFHRRRIVVLFQPCAIFSALSKPAGALMNLSRYCLIALAFSLCSTLTALAQTNPSTTLDIPAAARPGPNFDVKAATDAWLATIPSDKKARPHAYHRRHALEEGKT